MNTSRFLDESRAAGSEFTQRLTVDLVTFDVGNQTYFSTRRPSPRAPSDRDYAFVWIYFSPLILIVGTIGNLLTLCVMRRRRLAGTSTCVYLSAMAIADTLALLFRIPPEFLEACDVVVFSEINRWTCKFEKFSFYTASDTAIWILVVFTLDRLIAVCSPLRKHTFCVPRRAVVVCLSVTFLAVAKNFHVFWTRDHEYNSQTGELRVCGRPKPYKYFENEVRTSLALALVSIVPFFVIVVSNTIIVRKLIYAHKLRHRSLSVFRPQGDVSAAAAHVGNGNGRCNDEDDVSRVTAFGKSVFFSQTSLMCLAVSLAFLLCVTPSIVLTMGREQWKKRPAYYAARAVSHQLSCVNHAINFFLYCFTGQRFRDELIGFVRRRRSSSTPFDETTRRYYMARRSTQSSTSILAMHTLSMSAAPVAPITEDSEPETEKEDN